MRRVSVFILLVFLAFAGAANWLPNAYSVVNAQSVIEPAQPPQTAPSILSVDNQPTAADPLPSSCPGGLPGDAPAVCCVSGLVYVDGQPVAGADVEITNASGQVVRTVTQVQSGYEYPYYHVNLSGVPLNMQPGELITVTARYNGRQDVEIYRVDSGGQQVDLVLTRQQQQTYVSGNRLFKQTKPGDVLNIEDIAIDRLGQIYMLDTGNSRVQVIDSSGKYVNSWGTYGTAAGQFTFLNALAIDVNNNFLYVLEGFNNAVEGTYDVIQKFSTNGELLDTWLLETGTLYDAIAVDGHGNIYVTSRDKKTLKFDKTGTKLAFSNGTDARRIHVDNQHGIIYQALPDSSYRTDFDGNYLDSVKFGDKGRVLAVDANGIVYAEHLGRIWQFDHLGMPIREWCQQPHSMDTTIGTWMDSENNLYAIDRRPTGGIVKLRSDCTEQLINNNQEYPIQSFYGATALAADSIGNLFIVYYDYITGNNSDKNFTSVQILDKTNNFTRTWGKFGLANGEFTYTNDITIDKHGNVYLVDGDTDRVQKFTSNGTWLTTWTAASLGISETTRGFHSVAINSIGNVYISTERNGIIELDSQGNVVARIGGLGNEIGQFSNPWGLAIDREDNLFIADYGNYRIQKLASNGTWTAFDLPRDNNYTNNPYTVAVDNNGDIYVGSLADGKTSLYRLISKLDRNGNLQFNWRLKVDLYDINVDSSGSIVALIDSYHGFYLQRFDFQNFTQPIATINRLSNNASTLSYDSDLQAFGQGQDSDETPGITAYEWTFHAYDSGQTQIFTTTTPTFTIAASQLGTGSHQLTLRVRDDENEWSEPVTTNKIYVNPPVAPPWTFLLYLVGDYDDNGKLLEDFVASLQKIAGTFNSTNVRIAVQLDGPGNDGSRRYFFGPGEPGFTHPEFIGEQAMDKSSTLRDFIRDGQKRFPAQHYYLAIADHGQAIRGIGWDKTSGDDAYLSIDEIRRALSDSAVADIDVLHLDGCSMGLFDVAYELRHNADFLIVSQYLAWSYFAYADYQVGITANTTPEQLAKSVAETYAKKAAQDQYPYTLSVLNLNPSQMDGLKHSLDDLAALLKEWVRFDEAGKDARIQVLRQIRSQSQKFNSNADFLNNDSDFYVDLADWLSNLLAYTPEAGAPDFTDAIRDETKRLQRGITLAGGGQPLVIANQQMSNFLPSKFLPEGTREVYPTGVYIDLTHANGVSVYYPIDKDAPKPPSAAGASATTPTFDEVYNDYIHERIFEFTLATRWDEFLQLAVGAPQADAPLAPPPVPILILPTVPATSTQTQLFLPVIMR